MLRPADDGGSPCPHLVGAEPCAPHAYSWHVAPWDDCQPLGKLKLFIYVHFLDLKIQGISLNVILFSGGSPCGEGTKKRAVRCLRSDGVFVNDSYCPVSIQLIFLNFLPVFVVHPKKLTRHGLYSKSSIIF